MLAASTKPARESRIWRLHATRMLPIATRRPMDVHIGVR
jgi:hypothetical protein